jgi:ATP-binding cassette subfamily F protein 3
LLGNFLFSGETIEKKVKVLSGGEKARLALAKMLLEPVNLLILDEPTNHLDMRAKDILKNALLHYDGTLIIVSHDRDFLHGLTNKTIEFRNHKVFEHLGDVYEFLSTRKIDSFNSLNTPSDASSEKKQSSSDNKLAWEQRKERERIKRKIRSRIEKAEEEIISIEEQISELDTILQNPDPEKDMNPVYTKYQELKDTLQKVEKEWEKHSFELEEFEEDE